MAEVSYLINSENAKPDLPLIRVLESAQGCAPFVE
jgi:hypothetical protein